MDYCRMTFFMFCGALAGYFLARLIGIWGRPSTPPELPELKPWEPELPDPKPWEPVCMYCLAPAVYKFSVTRKGEAEGFGKSGSDWPVGYCEKHFKIHRPEAARSNGL